MINVPTRCNCSLAAAAAGSTIDTLPSAEHCGDNQRAAPEMGSTTGIPIVDGIQAGVGCGRDDGASGNGSACGPLVDFPQACQLQHAAVLRGNPVRLFGCSLALLPFVVTVGYNQTNRRLRNGPMNDFFSCRVSRLALIMRLPIDKSLAQLGTSSPAVVCKLRLRIDIAGHRISLWIGLVGNYDHLLAGCDVVAWLLLAHSGSESSTGNNNCAHWLGGVFRVKRPHIKNYPAIIPATKYTYTTMTEFIQLTTTTASEQEALEPGLQKPLVDRRLAACVHISGPIRSIYRWQGELCDAVEFHCSVKSLAVHAEQLMQIIRHAQP
ncbi:MAG: divalent cation tolerance protein CutA [Pirellulaceae bacterium]